MIDREKVIKGLECCTFILGKRKCNECPYRKDLPDNGCYQLQDDFHALLKEQEGYVSVPFSWLVKFCSHIDFKEPLTDEEREKEWKKKLEQQFDFEEQSRINDDLFGTPVMADANNLTITFTNKQTNESVDVKVMKYTPDNDSWQADAHINEQRRKMSDKNSIIDDLDEISHYNDEQMFYNDIFIRGIADEVIALLKEQEAVEPINNYGTFRCGNCRNIVGYNDGHGRGYQNNFCSKCGKMVKWE